MLLPHRSPGVEMMMPWPRRSKGGDGDASTPWIPWGGGGDVTALWVPGVELVMLWPHGSLGEGMEILQPYGSLEVEVMMPPLCGSQGWG